MRVTLGVPPLGQANGQKDSAGSVDDMPYIATSLGNEMYPHPHVSMQRFSDETQLQHPQRFGFFDSESPTSSL